MNEELLSDGTEEDDTGFWKSLTRCSLITSWNNPFFLSFCGSCNGVEMVI